MVDNRCARGTGRGAGRLIFWLGLGAAAFCAQAGKPPARPAAASRGLSLPLASLVKKEPPLVEFWSLNGSLAGVRRPAGLKSVQKDLVFQPGPFRDSRSLDLPEGQALVSDPAMALDFPSLSVELLFMVPGSKGRKAGEGCLFGIRNGPEARFSVHYRTGSYYLEVWDGKAFTRYESDFCLQMDQWYHLAVAVSDTSATVWLNGKKCKVATERGYAPAARGLPLVVGASDAQGQGDRAGIRVSHLAVYRALLSEASVTGRLKAMGWPDPAAPNEAQKVDQMILALEKDHGLKLQWKYHPDFISPHFKNQWKGNQASPEQAQMQVRVFRKMCAAWPRELTKHIQGVYVYDCLEMSGVKGVCIEYDFNLHMSSNLPEYVILPRAFHEATHAITRQTPLDANLWKAQMAAGARYLGDEAVKVPDPMQARDDLHEKGFLLQYSQIDLMEEFAVLSQYLFTEPGWLKERMQKFPEVRKRVLLTMEYFKALSDKVDFSAYDDVLPNGTTPPPNKR